MQKTRSMHRQSLVISMLNVEVLDEQNNNINKNTFKMLTVKRIKDEAITPYAEPSHNNPNFCSSASLHERALSKLMQKPWSGY